MSVISFLFFFFCGKNREYENNLLTHFKCIARGWDQDSRGVRCGAYLLPQTHFKVYGMVLLTISTISFFPNWLFFFFFKCRYNVVKKNSIACLSCITETLYLPNSNSLLTVPPNLYYFCKFGYFRYLI